MKILVINCGSSSIKYRIIDSVTGAVPASGVLEEIGGSAARLRHRRVQATGEAEESVLAQPVADHHAALDLIMATITAEGEIREPGHLDGIGHRVVHGGEAFSEPVLIDERVVEGIRGLIPLAPLHNPGNLMGIEVTLRNYPRIPQVAVFDTAFHATLPPKAFHYALPPDWYETHRVRRYGFHGTSHHHVAKATAAYLGRPLEDLNLITLHLGNGASATAIRAGKSVDTSMGMTPLEGLIMGTRSGDLDPAILFYLRRERGLLVDDIESLLNYGSGLKGVCGTSDMREIEWRVAAGEAAAQLALEMYAYRIRKYVGAYCAVLGRVDALVFTGGIGENSSLVRRLACEGLERLGITIDTGRNETPYRGEPCEVQAADGEVRVLVIPAGEELEIALLAAEVIKRSRQTPVPPP